MEHFQPSVTAGTHPQRATIARLRRAPLCLCGWMPSGSSEPSGGLSGPLSGTCGRGGGGRPRASRRRRGSTDGARRHARAPLRGSRDLPGASDHSRTQPHTLDFTDEPPWVAAPSRRVLEGSATCGAGRSLAIGSPRRPRRRALVAGLVICAILALSYFRPRSIAPTRSERMPPNKQSGARLCRAIVARFGGIRGTECEYGSRCGGAGWNMKS